METCYADIVQNVTLVNVCPEMDPLSIIIGGAVHIPYSEIPEKVPFFRNSKNNVLLYCDSGKWSTQAAYFLRSCGLKNVFLGGSIHTLIEYNKNNGNIFKLI